MRGADRRGRASGALAGAAVVVVGACAHLAAGGRLAAGPFVAAIVIAAVAGGLAAGLIRWTFWRSLAVAALAQPLVHATFGADAGHGSQHGTAHAAHALPSAHPAESFPAVTMWVAHLGLAVVVAVLVRWGASWLRTMPLLVRAVAQAARRSVIIAPARSQPLPAFVGAGRGLQGALSWDCRGPPR